MEDFQNPYAPPKAELSQPQPAELPSGNPMFTPGQALFGTFFGGPLAGTYFLRSNFLAKGELARAKATTLWGIAFSLAMLGLLPFLPDRMPHWILPLAYGSIVRAIVEKMQLRKADANGARLHKNGRVALVAVAGLAIFVMSGVAIMVAYQMATATPVGE
jgi:hypothetical protein